MFCTSPSVSAHEQERTSPSRHCHALVQWRRGEGLSVTTFDDDKNDNGRVNSKGCSLLAARGLKTRTWTVSERHVHKRLGVVEQLCLLHCGQQWALAVYLAATYKVTSQQLTLKVKIMPIRDTSNKQMSNLSTANKGTGSPHPTHNPG